MKKSKFKNSFFLIFYIFEIYFGPKMKTTLKYTNVCDKIYNLKKLIHINLAYSLYFANHT